MWRVNEVQTTCGSKEEAQYLGSLAVGGSLAACSHVYKVNSAYRWEGTVQAGKEYVVSLVTVPENVDALVMLLVENHSYDTPAILVREELVATQKYWLWVVEGTTHDDKRAKPINFKVKRVGGLEETV